MPVPYEKVIKMSYNLENMSILMKQLISDMRDSEITYEELCGVLYTLRKDFGQMVALMDARATHANNEGKRYLRKHEYELSNYELD